MNIITVNISEIKLNPNNPRIIKDENFKKLVRSIRDFPEMLRIRPIVVNDDMMVLGGNMRLRACQELGLTEIPVIRTSELTEEQQREFIIKDNAAYGTWDWDRLANEWDTEQLIEWGVELPVFETEQLKAEEDDYEIPDEIETDIVLGDLFEIGNHRLLCGDSTDAEQVAKLMNGEKADMGFNDPPYGMKKEKEGIVNDNLNFSDLLKFNNDWITLQFSYLKDNGSFYCWGIDEPLMDIYSEIIKPYIKDKKATFRNLITWDKGSGQGQKSEEFRMYPIADEKCLFIMCGVQGFNNNADNYFEGWESIRSYLLEQRKKAGWDVPIMKKIAGHSDIYRDHWTSKSQFNLPTRKVYESFQNYCRENNIDAFKKEYDEIKKEFYSTRAYFDNIHDNMNNVWHFERTKNKERFGNHATPKPIELCSRAIKTSCPEGGLIIDFFLGSGSTMVAAHQLNRKCYGIEIEPKYCQVIIDRMRKLDPEIVIKKNGKII